VNESVVRSFTFISSSRSDLSLNSAETHARRLLSLSKCNSTLANTHLIPSELVSSWISFCRFRSYTVLPQFLIFLPSFYGPHSHFLAIPLPTFPTLFNISYQDIYIPFNTLLFYQLVRLQPLVERYQIKLVKLYT
jgi:hypothetical protein